MNKPTTSLVPADNRRKWYEKLNDAVQNFPIRTRLFLITFGVILLFLVIIFFCNSLFLKPYYQNNKEQSLKQTLHKISMLDFSDTVEGGYASENLSAKLRYMEEAENIQVIILDDSLGVFYCESEDTVFDKFDRFSGARQWFNSLFEIEPDYKGNGTLSDPIIGTRRNSRTDTTYLSLYAMVPVNINGSDTYYYVLINTPLSAMDDAVAVFNDFALILGIVAMIISGLMSVLLCSNFVEPILQINNATKRMAAMDFSVKLDINSNDELGQLAQSINYLSSELETKINELKVANEQLKRDIEEKEKIDIMRQELISNVSHELKTPLAIIMGYCEGLQLNVNNEEKDYYCSVIADEAVKMNNLAARLLNVAELESGTYLDLTEFSLAELAEERLKTMSYIFAEHNITTEFKASGDSMINADYGRIEEVLNNLLSNAKHHTPDGGRISVDVHEIPGGVQCNIYNSGSHIPDESLERIWESFYKVDKARTRKYGGSGLGLKIVSSILDMHSGKYSAVNTEDGVIFSFALPRAHKENAE